MAVNEAGPEIRATYPAHATRVGEIRRDVTRLASAAGADEDALLRIRLAVSEAATNAIVHAYRDDPAAAGDVVVLVRRADDVLDVSIRDTGVGLSPRSDSPGMGLGLSVMAHEACSCEINSVPGGGTEVVLRFALDAQRPL